jgi:arginyl-tRNA synthetase
MSTRHGRVIFLKDLIGESFERIKNILIERERNLSDSDTKAVALGAIVYSFLSQDRERDWIFEWDKVLAFEGNSGPYLQYTYVRWNKIMNEINEA